MKRFVSGLVVALAIGQVGCGGDSPQPKTADSAKTAKPGVQPGASDVSSAAKEAYERGWKAWLAGDLPAAKKAFGEAASADAKSGAPHHGLGVVAEAQGDRSTAQQEFRTAFTLKPDFEVAMGAYAMSLVHAGHPGEAETFLNDKKAKTPNSPRITTYLAEVKSIQGDHGTAQALAQDALRMDPDFKEAMVTIARDHYRAHKMDLARYALQAMLEGFGDASPPRDKDNAEAHLLRGLIAKEAGQRPLAMNDFEAALKTRPDLVEALIQLGIMRLEAGNAQEAMPLLESAVRYAPKDANAHLNLGDAYRLLGRPADARREFETALAQDSSLLMAHYNLGLMYLFSPNVPGSNPKDQVAAAIKELEAFKSMRPAKSPQGEDVDELLSRAKAKQAELSQAGGGGEGSAPPAAAAAPPADAKKTDAKPAGKK